MSIEQIVLASIDMFVTLVASAGHTFILLVIALDVSKSRRLHLGDQLICKISALNISDIFMNVFENVFLVLKPIKISTDAANKCFVVLYLTIYSSNIWFSTWLSLYFCLKIVKINQWFYIYLQKMFPKVAKWIFILTVLQSFISGFLSVWTNPKALSSNATYTEYVHEGSLKFYEWYIPHINMYSVTFSFSFLILYTSALTTIFFLYKHMKKMKNNIEGPSGAPNVEAHVRAIRTILSLLAINSLDFVAGLYWFNLNNTEMYHYGSFLCSTLKNMLIPLVLIRMNSKLNKALHGFFRTWFST